MQFFDELTWVKWQGWARAIEADLSRVVDDRNDFDTFASVVDENLDWILANQGGSFLDFVRRSYVANVSMGIRRQLKAQKDSISLMGLMNAVCTHADLITFDRYTTFQKAAASDNWDWRIPTFRKLSDDGIAVTRTVVESHVAEVKRLNIEIEEFADRVIAHHDKRGSAAEVSFDQLRASVAHFDEVAQKYIQFFTGIQMSDETLGAKLLDDAFEVFRHPFIKPSGTGA